jgi:DNA-binding NtrC family response regulator
MLIISTIDPILKSHLHQTLNEKSDPFLILEEGENITDSVFRHHPSLVILDLYLSHPSGIQILRQLRAEGYAGKVVVLGGQSAQSLVPEATRMGALQIVGRPFSANQVLRAVRVAKETLNDDPD